MCSMVLTVVVSARSYQQTIRPDMSDGSSPL